MLYVVCNVPSPSYKFAILTGSFCALMPQMLIEGGIGSLGCKGRKSSIPLMKDAISIPHMGNLRSEQNYIKGHSFSEHLRPFLPEQSVPVPEPGRTSPRPEKLWCWFSGQNRALGGAGGNLEDEQGMKRVWGEGSIWKEKVPNGRL